MSGQCRRSALVAPSCTSNSWKISLAGGGSRISWPQEAWWVGPGDRAPDQMPLICIICCQQVKIRVQSGEFLHICLPSITIPVPFTPRRQTNVFPIVQKDHARLLAQAARRTVSTEPQAGKSGRGGHLEGACALSQGAPLHFLIYKVGAVILTSAQGGRGN